MAIMEIAETGTPAQEIIIETKETENNHRDEEEIATTEWNNMKKRKI